MKKKISLLHYLSLGGKLHNLDLGTISIPISDPNHTLKIDAISMLPNHHSRVSIFFEQEKFANYFISDVLVVVDLVLDEKYSLPTIQDQVVQSFLDSQPNN